MSGSNGNGRSVDELGSSTVLISGAEEFAEIVAKLVELGEWRCPGSK